MIGVTIHFFLKSLVALFFHGITIIESAHLDTLLATGPAANYHFVSHDVLHSRQRDTPVNTAEHERLEPKNDTGSNRNFLFKRPDGARNGGTCGVKILASNA